MKISVVTVCYNAADVLEKTMLSVLNQTYKDIEYIIIDGGSTDGTVDIIKKYADRISYWVSEPDKGIYDAMNKGIKKATGEWINFMNAGDCFTNDEVVKKVFNQINCENKRIIYGDMNLCGKEKLFKKAKSCSFFSRNMPCSHQAVFVSTKNKQELYFDTRFKYAADYNCLYHLWEKYGCKKIVRVDVTIVDFDNMGISSLNKRKVFEEVVKINNSKGGVIYYWDMFKIIVKELLWT